jgi:hypothetical protein
MKHQSIDCFRTALLVLAGVSVCSTALAQDVGVRHHTFVPGETYKIELSFSGPGAAGMQIFGVELDLLSERVQGQKEMQPVVSGAKIDQLSPGTFQASMPITNSAATGSYRLKIIASPFPGVTFPYHAGVDFELPDVKIENMTKVPKPKLTVTEKP